MVWETNRLLMEGRHFLGFLLELGHIRTSCETVMTRHTHTQYRKKVILRTNAQTLSMKATSLNTHALFIYLFDLNGMIRHDS